LPTLHILHLVTLLWFAALPGFAFRSWRYWTLGRDALRGARAREVGVYQS
jgi:hypothetical protein